MRKRIMKLIVLIGVISIVVTGCSSKKDESKKLNCKRVDIQFIGNSCFLFTLDDGKTILTDPYEKSFNDAFSTIPELEPDIVTTTHDGHPDHDGWDQIKNKKYIEKKDMDKTTNYSILKNKSLIFLTECQGKTLNIDGVKITEYKTDHVSYPGLNHSIIITQVGDFKIVHMGETDTVKKGSKVYNAMKDADVLLFYAGEYDKKTNKDMYKLGQDLNAKVMIPEHYSNLQEFYGEPTAADIKKELSGLTTIETQDKFELTKESVKDAKQKVILLNSICKE